MPSASQCRLTLLSCLLVAPGLCLASSLAVNGTCDAGTCPPTDTLAPGSSIPLAFFNFDVTVNGDSYDISGDYSASNTTNSPSGTTDFGGDVTATYIGGTPTAQSDVLTIDILQDFTVPGTYSLAGTYDEGAFVGINGAATGSSYSFQILYNGDSVGLLGPYTTSGTHSSSTYLALGGTSLDADSQFTFDFAAGTPHGASMTTTPEPGGLIPVAAILALGLGVPAIRRFRMASKKVG
jgi:hypothetical protein